MLVTSETVIVMDYCVCVEGLLYYAYFLFKDFHNLSVTPHEKGSLIETIYTSHNYNSIL